MLPILSDKCYHCHGPDEKARRAGLRFDKDGPAFQPAKSGAVALVPVMFVLLIAITQG